MQVSGSTEATKVDTEREYDPVTGETLIEIWEGTLAEIESLYQTLSNQGLRVRRRGKAPAQLEVIYGEGDVAGAPQETETWDLSWSEERKALKYHPRYSGTGVTDDTKSKIRQVEQDIDNPKLDENGEPITDPVTNDYGDALANEYRDKRQAGNDEYMVWRPVLTQRKITSWRSTSEASNTDVGKIVSIPSVKASDKLGSIVNDYEWIKLPSEKQVVGGKIHITTTYLGAESWDADLYGGGGSP
jgi:hypothetical protein